MFWEDSLLTMASDWTKTQAMSGPERKSLQRKMVKTCTARTSNIFIRCALVTKPAESRLISEKIGAAAGAAHWASFVARNGESMCTERNYLWALALQVEHVDRKPFGSFFIKVSTETGIFTVLGGRDLRVFSKKNRSLFLNSSMKKSWCLVTMCDFWCFPLKSIDRHL